MLQMDPLKQANTEVRKNGVRFIETRTTPLDELNTKMTLTLRRYRSSETCRQNEIPEELCSYLERCRYIFQIRMSDRSLPAYAAQLCECVTPNLGPMSSD